MAPENLPWNQTSQNPGTPQQAKQMSQVDSATKNKVEEKSKLEAEQKAKAEAQKKAQEKAAAEKKAA